MSAPELALFSTGVDAGAGVKRTADTFADSAASVTPPAKFPKIPLSWSGRSELSTVSVEHLLDQAAAIPIGQEGTQQVEFLDAVKSARAVATQEETTDCSAPAMTAQERAATTGDFDTRDAVGQVWAKLPSDHPTKQAYSQVKGQAARKQFRSDWAKEHFQYVLAEKTHEQSFRSVDETKGEWMTFGGLVLALGGWEWGPAVDGAKKIALKCARLGGKWCFVDEASELPHFSS